MGLRGKKPDALIEKRNQHIWRKYLTLKALGYYPKMTMYGMIAESIGVPVHTVGVIISMKIPERCCDEA